MNEINDVEGDRLKIDAHNNIKVHPSKHFIEQNLPTIKLMVSSLHAQTYLKNHFIVLICSGNSFLLISWFNSSNKFYSSNHSILEIDRLISFLKSTIRLSQHQPESNLVLIWFNNCQYQWCSPLPSLCKYQQSIAAWRRCFCAFIIVGMWPISAQQTATWLWHTICLFNIATAPYNVRAIFSMICVYMCSPTI